MNKTLLSLLIGSLFVSLPAMAEDITYTGNGTELKPAPAWTYLTGSYLYPGTRDNPGASGNTVTIDHDPATGGVIHPDGVFGGLSESEASNNTVSMINGQVGNGSGYVYLYGGVASSPSGTTTASGNTVNLSGGNFYSNDYNDIRGGVASSDSGTATASGNTVNLSGGTFNANNYGNTITGGNAFSYSGTATASGNTVNISGGTFNANGYNWITGGAASSDSGTATATHNTVNLSGGNFYSNDYNDIRGGVASSDSGTATASGNTVNLSGGTFNANSHNQIYGGYAYSDSGTATATHNTVIIGSEADIGSNAKIFGGDGTGSAGSDFFTGNRLFIAGQRTVMNIGNFEYLNFTLPNDILSAGPMITATGSVAFGGAATVETINMAGGPSALKAGDTVTIIQAASLSGSLANSTATGMKGMSMFYEWEGIGISNNTLTATLKSATLNPQTHALLQGRSAQTAMLTQGGDLAAGAGLASMQASVASGSRSFFAMQGGSSRYETGSGIDMDSFSLMAGAAWGMKANPDATFSAGLFVETGTGSYSSTNSFTGMNAVRGSGNTDYIGVGALASVQTASGFHADAAIRAGRVESDLKTDVYVAGDQGRYDEASSLYLGGHVSGGYLVSLTAQDMLDAYLRYAVTWTDSDSVTVLGDRYRFDSSTSHRLRGGLRYSRTQGVFMPFAGVAYEYEFDGKASGSVDGYRLKETDMGGGTVIGEIGLAWMPQENTRLDVSFEGFAGQRDGVMGNLRFNYRF